MHFDPENGTIILPDAYSEIVSSDAKFEVVTPVEAQKLVLERQSDLVGLKKLIITIDKADMTRKATRNIIIDFFKKFPEFKSNDFYISGESYAGIYVPYLAQLLITNKDSINLKGILVGNGLTDLNIDIEQALIDFAYEHALYSYETYQDFKKYCKVSTFNSMGNSVTKACNKVRKEIRNSLKGIKF